LPLATVQEAWLTIAEVEIVVRRVTHEHDSRAMMHMTVIGNIYHQLVEHVIANPAMKDGNEFLEIRAVDVFRE
jgi:hypothetical protein